MNYLINREFIANEVLKGYGIPLVDPFGVYSPEYLNVIDIVEEFGFRYNPSLAEELISDAITNAGAIKQNGRWFFEGNPITIKILIRSDDSDRKSLGELVASELEKIGFTVFKDYGDLNKANRIIYASDPQDLQWQVYTEAFAGTGAFVKDNAAITAQMYAPWQGNMPGGQNPSFWNYQNLTLDQITQRIFLYNFTSEEVRNDLVRNATRAGIQEAVRIFLARNIDPFVASASLRGLVNDFGAGITSKYSLINVRPTEDKSLNIGVKQIYQGAWNNIGGFTDTYSTNIYSAISDSGTFRNPYTGEVIPMRNEWTNITTKGPLNRLVVAPDAQIWDPTTQQWTTQNATTAMSKVTYKILYSKWHNGIPMDKSDLLYSYYFPFEWATNEGENDITIDPEYASIVSPSLPLIKGIKFITDDLVESYVDQWHYDEKEIAEAASIWSAVPWEITAATERLVASGKVAYSRGEATAKNIDWLSLIIPQHAMMIKSELQKMTAEGFVPTALKDIVSIDNAKKRYDASIKWIDAHKHAIVSNGPFFLDNFNPSGRTITIRAYRDNSYPFDQGHWSLFESPKLATIKKVEAPNFVTIGQSSKIRVYIDIDGQPTNNASISYFISDKDGKLVSKGEAEHNSNETGNFEINLKSNETSKLSIGPSLLKIFATSDYAFRPDLSTRAILAIPSANTTLNTQTLAKEKEQSSQNVEMESTQNEKKQSGCLIATATYGSHLAPQVRFLRDFRDNYILSTTTGVAFMNSFDLIYYSFSPKVADYERQQPWLQQTLRIALYPLLEILSVSEKAHSITNGGEIGTLFAGTTASLLIGATYLSPLTIVARQLGIRISFKKFIIPLIILLCISAISIGVDLLFDSFSFLSISTVLFVLATSGISLIVCYNLVSAIIKKLKMTIHNRDY
jgi:peptide/nickel transport system substrate-binding protein